MTVREHGFTLLVAVVPARCAGPFPQSVAVRVECGCGFGHPFLTDADLTRQIGKGIAASANGVETYPKDETPLACLR